MLEDEENMSQLTISVALCTCNGEKYLREQLESIARQTCQPDELVVCDDASTDRTIEIIRDFSETASFPVRLFVNEKRLGSGRNFERAIGLCQRDVIALSDQDDVWAMSKLDSVKSFFNCYPDTDALFTDAEIVDQALQPKGYRLWDAIKFSVKERREVEDGDVIHTLLRHNVVTGATMAFRAELRPLVLPVPEGVVHDAWIALLAAVAGQVRIISLPLILYRQHNANQIGVTKFSLAERIQRPCEQRIRDARAVLRMYESVPGRLRQLPASEATPALLDDFFRKAGHIRVRIKVITREAGWLKSMAAEIMRGHYHRYSTGWWGVGNDLVRCRPSHPSVTDSRSDK